MVTLSIPLDASDRLALATHVRAEWEDVARKQGVDPERIRAAVGGQSVYWHKWATGPAPQGQREEMLAAERALAALALRLADAPWYYYVTEDGGWRVVGFAAVQCPDCGGTREIDVRTDSRCARCKSTGLLRLRDLYLVNPLDDRLKPANAALLAAREARLGSSAPDAKLEGARARHAGAYPKG